MIRHSALKPPVRRRLLGAALFCSALLVTATAWTMPSGDPGQGHGNSVFGQPLESGDLPVGVLTVKVVGQDISDGKAGITVQLLDVHDGKEHLHGSAKSGSNGRARFEGLRAGASYRAIIEGTKASVSRSPTFTMPASAGVRMALSLLAPSAAGNPHAGNPHVGNPHAGQGHGGPGKAKDESGAAKLKIAPELTPDKLRVRVRDASGGKPIVGSSLRLRRGKLSLESKTGADGQAVMTVPAGKEAYTVSVQHDGIDYASDKLLPPTEGGQELTFSVFGRSADLGALSLGQGSHLLARIGANGVGFLQVLALTNTSSKLLDPGSAGLRIPLPRGAAGVQLGAEQRTFARLSKKRDAVIVTRPLPPGTLTLRVSYDLPSKNGSLVFVQQLPVAMTSSILAITNNKLVKATGPSVGKRVQRRMGGSDAQMSFFKLLPQGAGQRFEMTLFDLPYHDRRPTYVVLGGASLMVLWAFFALLGAGRRMAQGEKRREELLDQLARLAHEHERGELAAEPYAEKRAPLMTELRRRWG